ncbi:hypothetical protein [Shewanella phage FishSpeaker]|nr:hypothetical protein [Shewanella phage FishSpeaker]
MSEEIKVAYCLGEVIELGDDPSKHLEEVADHFQVSMGLHDLSVLLAEGKKLSLSKVALQLPMFDIDPKIIIEFNIKEFDVQILKGNEYPDGSWEKNLIGVIIRAGHMLNDAISNKVIMPTNFTVQ